jgi:hypothetical protein
MNTTIDHALLVEQVKEKLSSMHFCESCGDPQDGKWHCCQETHFVSFNDLPAFEQEAMIEWDVDFALRANK